MGWSLKVAMDETKVLEPVYTGFYRTIFHFLVEFTVLLAVIVIVSGLLSVPIKRLAELAKKLATGDLDVHIGGFWFSKEIDQLAQTFDKMGNELKSSIDQRVKEESTRKIVEEELAIARRIQASLLPRVFPPYPERKEFDIHAMNEPAEFVAGDFFDFFLIDPDTLAFVVADVSGHGIPAAMFMAISRTIIRTFASPKRSPSEVIDHVNRMLNSDNEDMMFVTMFYGHYNIVTGELIYVNAGHDPPYIIRKDSHLEELPGTGPLVAAFEYASYEEQTVRMEPGDLLVAFTDGVTEAHSTNDDVMYGRERLEQLLEDARERSVESICNRVYTDADEFVGRENLHDDVTIFVLRRNER
jgi:sigma-B regulation protein RsbU (phosphoserine phosphatase)